METDACEETSQNSNASTEKIKIKMNDGTTLWVDASRCLLIYATQPTDSELQKRQESLRKECKKPLKRSKPSLDSPRTPHLRVEAGDVEEGSTGPGRTQGGPRAAAKRQVGKVGKKRNVEREDLSLSQQVRLTAVKLAANMASPFPCMPIPKPLTRARLRASVSPPPSPPHRTPE